MKDVNKGHEQYEKEYTAWLDSHEGESHVHEVDDSELTELKDDSGDIN